MVGRGWDRGLVVRQAVRGSRGSTSTSAIVAITTVAFIRGAVMVRLALVAVLSRVCSAKQRHDDGDPLHKMRKQLSKEDEKKKQRWLLFFGSVQSVLAVIEQQQTTCCCLVVWLGVNVNK